MSSLLSVIENVPSASEISSPSKTLTVIIVLGCPPFQTTPNPNTSLTHRGLEYLISQIFAPFVSF